MDIKKSHRVKSGKYGGRFNAGISFLETKITLLKVLCRKAHCDNAKSIV